MSTYEKANSFLTPVTDQEEIEAIREIINYFSGNALINIVPGCEYEVKKS